MTEPVDRMAYYRLRIAELENDCKRLRRKRDGFGWMRLGLAVTALVVVWMSLPQVWVLIPFIGLFLYVVKLDLQHKSSLQFSETLLEICTDEIRVLSHNYLHRADGAAFLDTQHPFAEDLDLFGKASLFQFLNRANGDQGKALLAKWLQSPASIADIGARQEAVRQLSRMPEWCQSLQAHGRNEPVRMSVEEATEAWLREPKQFAGKPLWMILRVLIPVLSLSWLGVYLADIITTPAFLTGLTVFIGLAFSISGKILPIYNNLNRISPQLASLAQSIQHIETASFDAALLRDLQGRCYHHGRAASGRIFLLRRILDRFDLRLNFVVHIPLNIFLLWDLQQVLALEGWKETNKVDTGDWFTVLAQMEALASLGTLQYNCPDWIFPELLEGEPCIDTRSVAHPLIAASKAVANDFRLAGQGQVALVTGSNMAGKSTFLRTIGVNLVLAGMGAPVCAKQFRCTPLPVMSSMRIRDNLEESTSTFYAELKKLKAIIDAVNAGENIIILLDEILRGTNSQDRHAGAMALVRQLIRQRATGIVATHDLGLAALENEFPGQVHNMHFDVQVNQAEMYFDYLLKPGVCRSMNASLLMQKIGIDL